MSVSFSPATLSLIAIIATCPAVAQEAPVREVTLFEAGVAEIRRETGEAREVVLRVPLRDVNDVLQSLVVWGEGTTGVSLSLAGETPVEDVFAVLPFGPEAATDLVALLREVPGVRVRVSDSRHPEGEVGTVMGVQEDCSDARGCERVLTLLGEDGSLRQHIFGAGLEIAILDPEIADAIPRGLSVLRETASGMVRQVAVTIEGEDRRHGMLTYVVAAPPWRTSYHALTGPQGEVDFQARAVINNAMGEDWEDVTLTLSSGSPRTLAADLFGQDRRQEPRPESGMPAPLEPGTAAVAEPEPGFLGMQFGSAEDEVDRLIPPPPPSIGVAEVGEDEPSEARYLIEGLVDLAAGRVLSLPFLAEQPETRHLSIWTGANMVRTGNPERVLEVTNDLSVRLPAGVVTVSDNAGGYLGDAALPMLAPGETSALPFASDMGLRVEEVILDGATLLSAGLQGGMLHATVEQVHETGYLVTSPSGEEREVLIDHPVLEGWPLDVVAGPEGEARHDEAGQGWLRFELPVGVSGAELVLREVRTTEDSHPISHMTPEAIRVWAERVPSADDRALLEKAAPLVEAMYQTQIELRHVVFLKDELMGEQERVRRLLDTVPRLSAAHDRFMRRLLDLEDRIAVAEAAVAAAEETAQAAQEAVSSLGRE